MADMRDCSPIDGTVIAENKDKLIAIGGRTAIVRHNQWIGMSEGDRHQVGLDFMHNKSLGVDNVSPECEAIILRLFPELNQQGP